MSTETPLTKNERLVLDTLVAADGPLKAYDLLARLKARGIRAPMTIYRALDRLEDRGIVHKLDGLGVFVVCNQDGPHAIETFLVCDGCASVTEVGHADRGIEVVDVDAIEAVTTASGFTTSSTRLEVRGRCRDCC